MTTSKDLRDGTATALQAAGVAEYRAGGYAGFTGVPIFMSKMPSAPDRVVVITTYRRPAPHEWGVQVRVRGSKGGTVSAEDLADVVNTALHGLTDLTWGGTDVDLLSLVSSARLGFDSNDRDEVSLNYRAVTSDPSTALID